MVNILTSVLQLTQNKIGLKYSLTNLFLYLSIFKYFKYPVINEFVFSKNRYLCFFEI